MTTLVNSLSINVDIVPVTGFVKWGIYSHMSNSINDKMYMGENLHSSLDFNITYIGKTFVVLLLTRTKSNFFIYIAGL